MISAISQAELPEVTPEPNISAEDYQREIEQFEKLANLHQHPGCLDFVLKSIPIKPWIHQIKILRRYTEEFPHNGLIADEVGLGKTIETGLILRYLILSKKAQRFLDFERLHLHTDAIAQLTDRSRSLLLPSGGATLPSTGTL